MSKSILIDTTLCTACRGCQVACKQWHDLPAEKTRNIGSFQNPQDLSFITYKLVRMTETEVKGRLQWLFFPDQCRHCIDAPCLETAMDETAVYQDSATGAILYTRKTQDLDAGEIANSCPYNIPRDREDGTIAKCDFCNDRVHNGLSPACVTSCPTGAMTFGDRGDILKAAAKRLDIAKRRFPDARLLDADEVNVIYLVAFDPSLYAENAVADVSKKGISRGLAMKKMMGPLAKMFTI